MLPSPGCPTASPSTGTPPTAAGLEAEALNLRAALDAAAIVTVTDSRGTILEVNDAFCALCGYAREDLVGRTHAVLQSGTHPPEFFAALWRTILDGRVWHGEICNKTKDGRLFWVDTTIVPFLDHQGRLDRFFAIRHDITAQKAAEAESRRSRAMLARAQDIANLGNWELDLATDRVTASPVAFRLHGLEPADGPVAPETFSRHIHAEDRPAIERAVLEALKCEKRSGDHGEIGERQTSTVTVRIRNGGGELRYLAVEMVALAGESPARPLRSLIGTVQDVTERRRMEERLSFLALCDPLTGLPNRRLFADRLHHALLAARRADSRLAVLFLDLDRFKAVNDDLGHDIGDQLLIEVSRRLRSTLRDADTVSRLGGDEFAILLEDIESRAAAESIAEKLSAALKAPMVLDGHEVVASGSIGIALFPEDGTTSDTLLKQADGAMYRAKKSDARRRRRPLAAFLPRSAAMAAWRGDRQEHLL
jgi:diguanylate cyclase (GGDEF)-like protein/PAS domain S-box-containing protein